MSVASQLPDDLDIAEYTLGVLPADEAAHIQQWLDTDAQAASHILRWETRLLPLADALPPEPAPAALLERIQATLGPDWSSRQTAGSPKAYSPRTQASAPTPQAAATPAPRADAPLPAAQAPATGPATPPAIPRLIRPHTEAPAQNTRPAAAEPVSTAVPAPSTPERPDLRRQPEAAAPQQAGSARSPKGWRIACAALAALAVASTLLAWSAWTRPLPAPPAPPPMLQQVAVLQAPGSSSTPGWILTLDDHRQFQLKPLVSITLPAAQGVYLWTQRETDPQPRLLAKVDPSAPLSLDAQALGAVEPGQIFEMTQEPDNGTMPKQPQGPILFLGRTVGLN